METMKQSGLWSSLGTHGSVVVMWWLCISCCGETGTFNILSWQSRSIAPQNNKDLNQGILQLGPNLVILAWTGDVYVGSKLKMGKLGFEVKFDLEGQGRLPPKTIGTLTRVFCTYGPNLGILAWTGPESSCGQSRWHEQMARWTHRQI